jgi:hypothetical protein
MTGVYEEHLVEDIIPELLAEIERLTKLGGALFAEIDRLRPNVHDLNKLRAEIERWKLTVALREAEIDRLRGLLRDTQRVYHDTQWAQLTEARAEIERLRVENAALRRALELKP